MLKSATFLVVPGVMGGIGLLYDPGGFPDGQPAWEKAHLVEVGVIFDEEAVRSALPSGLEPTQRFTGGIAVYSNLGDRGIVVPSDGYVWIDLDYQAGARYIVRSFSTAGPQPDSAAHPDMLAKRHVDEEIGDGPLRADVMAGSQGGLDLVVQPILRTCQTGFASLSQQIFASGQDGRLQIAPNQIVREWCDADVVSASVLSASDDVLSGLMPNEILWAGVAVPLGPNPLDARSP